MDASTVLSVVILAPSHQQRRTLLVTTWSTYSEKKELSAREGIVISCLQVWRFAQEQWSNLWSNYAPFFKFLSIPCYYKSRPYRNHSILYRTIVLKIFGKSLAITWLYNVSLWGSLLKSDRCAGGDENGSLKLGFGVDMSRDLTVWFNQSWIDLTTNHHHTDSTLLNNENGSNNNDEG